MLKYVAGQVVQVPAEFFDDEEKQSETFLPCEIVRESGFRDDGDGGNMYDACYVVRRIADGVELPAVCADFF